MFRKSFLAAFVLMVFSPALGQSQVFVTSGTFDGALGGYAGADSICNAAASAAGHSGTWVAWLSGGSVDARDRIIDIEYRLLDGTVIANDLADLTDGSLDAPINLDENLATVPSAGFADDVWTSTDVDGTWGDSGHCVEWTTNEMVHTGQIGRANHVDGGWTDVAGGNSCGLPNRLYCFPVFEQVQVFVTSETFDGNLGGLAGADSICATAASNAGLSGTWTAWLSDGPIDARDRIIDAEYALLDGTIIANDLADLTDGSLDAPINLDETLATVPSAGFADDVWTATDADGTWGDSGHCVNWTTNEMVHTGQIGRANHVDGGWTDVGGGNSCDLPNRLYCFSGAGSLGIFSDGFESGDTSAWSESIE